jgi:hypothetical protein
MSPLQQVPDGPQAPTSLIDGTDSWQMSFGERAALVGILADVKPRVAIEIGTAQGGSLRRLAAHSGHVHSFDLVEPDPSIRALPNVTLHTGDSHALLPALLAELAEQGVNVDFALVDGDHSAPGVAQDVRHLLDSPAVRRSVIVMHDSMNEEVRRGMDSVDYSAWEKVRFVHLDCVAGYLYNAPLEGELWGGLAVIVVDDANPRPAGTRAETPLYQPTQRLVVAARDQPSAEEVAALRSQLAEHEAQARAAEAEAERLRHSLASVEGSRTWRSTEPLRALKRRLRG